MAIKHPNTFNESLPAGFDGLVEWDFLKDAGCFGNTKIEPMDLDLCVERNQRLLVWETKVPGKSIPKGQRLTLAALVHSGLATVFLIEGKRPGEFQSVEIWDGPGRKVFERMGANTQTIINMTKLWFEASNQAAPQLREWLPKEKMESS